MLPQEFERPVLELSGDILRVALQTMVSGTEEHGGIEHRYLDFFLEQISVTPANLVN